MIRVIDKADKFIPVIKDDKGITISFDFSERSFEGDNSDSKLGVWSEHTFTQNISFAQIKLFIINEINKTVDNKILSGFTWKDMPVWLSTENQFNYKAVYDVAVQTNGANLPLIFKFGDSENPIYYKFEEFEDLQDFYLKALEHINEQLVLGWKKKDSIDWSVYEDALNNLK